MKIGLIWVLRRWNFKDHWFCLYETQNCNAKSDVIWYWI